MIDEEALKEIERQEKRFAAAKCGRGLQLAKSAREYYQTIVKCRQKSAEVAAECAAASEKAVAMTTETNPLRPFGFALRAQATRRLRRGRISRLGFARGIPRVTGWRPALANATAGTQRFRTETHIWYNIRHHDQVQVV